MYYDFRAERYNLVDVAADTDVTFIRSNVRRCENKEIYNILVPIFVTLTIDIDTIEFCNISLARIRHSISIGGYLDELCVSNARWRVT